NLQTQYKYLDGSAGLSFNTQVGEDPANNLVLGIAYHHFNRPRNSFFLNQGVVMQPKWVYSADLKMGVSESAFITLHNDHVRQGSYKEFISGFMYGLKIGPYTDDPDYFLQGGVFLRWQDAVIPAVQLDYRPFSVSLSYDVNVSGLSRLSHGRGGYEFSLKYTGFLDRDNSSANAVRCPRF
ncbi:MAG TPA: type IX secretion system membrane protein PorP/SprF, partial [Flavisolibacter sp.]|nr:type IX secretion system membrane protein PorP/SprF [Flavisolibacter sp.]